MRTYTIHVPSGRSWRRSDAAIANAVAATRAVKEGFSWPAFFFSFLWAMTQRLWLVAAGLLVVELGLSALLDMLDGVSGVALTLGVMLITGWIANDLKRWGLARRGRHLAFPSVDLPMRGVVLADSGEEAVRRYYAETAPRDGYAEAA